MAMPAMQDLPDRFIEIACLCYGDPHFDHRSFHARAHAMLRENPWLAEANIWSASAAGNARAVEALLNGDPEEIRLLLGHNARTDEPFRGKLPWEHAMRLGRMEAARLLEQAGAPTVELDEVGRFVSMCMAGDERGARAMLEQAPDLSARAPKQMVQRAVSTKQKEAVQLVLELGFDPNEVEDNAAIHMAGVLAENEEILRILLAGGASLKLRDPWYDGTAAGWADFFDFADLRDKLLGQPGICLFDALDYGRLERVPEIVAHDPTALERPFAKCLTRETKPEDWEAPLVRMVLRGKTNAVRALLDLGADANARHPDGRSLVQVARDQGLEEIAGLLEVRAE